MDKIETLITDIEWLVDFENKNPNFLYTPL